VTGAADRRPQPGPAGQATVRAHNLALVLRTVAADEPVSRARLAARTGLTRGTVSSLVDELLAAGFVAQLSPARGAPGRPASPLQLNRSGPAGLGVEIGVDTVAACAVDLAGAVRAQRTAPSGHRSGPPAAALAPLARLAAEVVTEAAGQGLRVAGVAVAVPGVVGPAGVLERAPNLAGWHEVDVVAQVGAALAPVVGDVPVAAGNEADLAAFAEWEAGAAGPDFVHVSGGIGVGAGIVLAGRPFHGAGGRAGELGHVVVDPDGPACSCGGRGCLERAAGLEPLLRAAGAADLDALAAATAAGDPRARAAVTAAGRALGIALAGAVNLFDVPAVVLGGAYPRLGRTLVAAVEEEIAARVVWRSPVAVHASRLGGDAALRGAALSVVRGLIDGAAAA
jgi:predicted NBD/HSP70 family sugar kinase